LRPIAGFVVPAQTGPGAKPGQYTAAIGLRASSPGAYEIREVRIHYHVGTERYEIVVPEYARICAVTGDPLKTDCALPKTD
jgi:hypothetical protein